MAFFMDFNFFCINVVHYLYTLFLLYTKINFKKETHDCKFRISNKCRLSDFVLPRLTGCTWMIFYWFCTKNPTFCIKRTNKMIILKWFHFEWVYFAWAAANLVSASFRHFVFCRIFIAFFCSTNKNYGSQSMPIFPQQQMMPIFGTGTRVQWSLKHEISIFGLMNFCINCCGSIKTICFFSFII